MARGMIKTRQFEIGDFIEESRDTSNKFIKTMVKGNYGKTLHNLKANRPNKLVEEHFVFKE